MLLLWSGGRQRTNSHNPFMDVHLILVTMARTNSWKEVATDLQNKSREDVSDTSLALQAAASLKAL